MDYNSKYKSSEIEAILDSVGSKQDAIADLDAIRSGAEKGATALQSVPSEYVTEGELEGKGYLTDEQYKGTVTGVTFYGTDYAPDSTGMVYMGYPDIGAVKEIKVNGSTKTPTNGEVDLGTFLTQHQDISQKADLYNGKIITSQLPDYILGQVMYGGIINSGDSSNINVQTSVNYQNKYNVSQTATINKYQFWSQTGVYFISGANGTFFDKEVKTGDWLISTGSYVAKVDNTDAVSSVAGLTGVIETSALADALSLSAVATSGSYNDLSDKPTIPSAITESTVSGWGFTKNTGTYSKPSGGIPKSDLASAVQTSLGKADTAVQANEIAEFVTREDLAGVASTGSYEDLVDKPFIPTADSVRSWGFVRGVKVNGSLKNPSLNDGVVDLGTIEGGGSGGGSAAYPYVDNTTAIGTNYFTISPNHFYEFGEHDVLEISFGAEPSGVANEYLFQFVSGSEATSLTINADIKWTEDLVIEPNRIYQVSILKGLASVLSWKVEASITFPVTLEMGDNGAIGVALYSYLQNTYGEAASGTTLNEEIINNYNGVTFETVEYGTYIGVTGYWLNGYRGYMMSWALLEDGYLQRVLPTQET